MLLCAGPAELGRAWYVVLLLSRFRQFSFLFPSFVREGGREGGKEGGREGESVSERE